MSGLLLASATFAQPAPDDADGPDYNQAAANSDAVDPPSRVARLALINGAVSFVPAGENDWVEAQLNRPLITGDKLWTDRGARAELQIGSSAIRVDEQSSFNFLNLDDQTAQVELTQGTLNLRVRRLYDGQTYEIDTPTLAFVINRVGEYRIDVAPDGHGTIVTAFHGGGDAYGEAGARFRVEEGQSIRFNDPQLRDYVSNSLPSADDFDRFAFERDGRWDNSPSRHYVSEDVIGYDDLDSNGSWSDEPEYGNVWYPSSVAVGWSPYSYGQWGWVGAYGWTWVDSSPWGFAPFHYGRWAYVHNRWGWCPGPIHARPYYAPALVAFIGGGGVRVGIGGPVGWFPLGPRDVYVPGYRVSRDYFSRVNIYNTRINEATVNNFYGNYSRGNFDYSRVSYANRNITGAVTAVPGNVFVGARPVRGSAIAVNRETFANARVSGFAAIAPTRDSLAFRGRAAAAPPQAVVNRNIIAATRPPAPTASFAQREALLQRDPGRALPANQLRVAPTLTGREGVQAQRQALVGRPNINVVTTNGQPPARTLGPAVAPRNTLNQPQDNGRGPALRANNPEQQLQNNGVESRTIAGPQNGRPSAVTPDRNSLPSTRYVNPNASNNNSASSNNEGQPQNNGRAPINNLRTLPSNNGPQVQDSNVDRNALIREQRDNAAQNRIAPVDRSIQQDTRQQRVNPEFRSAPVEHAPQPQVQERQVQQLQQQQQVQRGGQPQVQEERHVMQQPFQRAQPQVQERQVVPQQQIQRVQPQVQVQQQPQVQVQQQQPQPRGERPAPQGRDRDEKKKDDRDHNNHR
jgi:hypothetical protein